MSKPTHLYRCFDEDGVLLYVGVATDPGRRLQEHRMTSGWMRRLSRVEVTPPIADRGEALALEAAAIREERPLFNSIHSVGVGRRAVDYRDTHLVSDTTDAESELAQLGRQLLAAKSELAEVTQLIRERVIVEAAEGVPETHLRDRYGVDRMTVRKWLGKR